MPVLAPYLCWVLFFARLPYRVRWDAHAAPLPAATEGGWPLVVFSHGLYGSGSCYSALCAEFASHGLVVIALEVCQHHPEPRAGGAVDFVLPALRLRDGRRLIPSFGGEATALQVAYLRPLHTHPPLSPSPSFLALTTHLAAQGRFRPLQRDRRRRLGPLRPAFHCYRRLRRQHATPCGGVACGPGTGRRHLCPDARRWRRADCACASLRIQHGRSHTRTAVYARDP